MKKVLYIGGFCMPDGNAAAQRVLGIAKAMRECDCDVRFSGLSRNIISQYEDGEIDGFEYRNYRYPASIGSWQKYLFGRDGSLFEIDNYQPQVVVLYNHPSSAIERIARYCHKKGIKVIADITEWYEPHGNPIFKAIKGYDTYRRMYKSHVELDGLICISRYLADFYKDRGITVVEIPPLVDVKQDKWHQQGNVNTTSIHIVYAGSPGAHKDRLDLILNGLDVIVSDLDCKVNFDIIGITEEQYKATWGDNARHPYATFNGRLPHNEVIKKLLNADFQIFLRPNTLPNRAGFPTKFVETITSGTLPITNLSSNLSQYLDDGKNGFVISSLDPETIRITLKNAIQLSRSEIDKMKDSLICDRFDYHNYIEIIASLL